MRESRKHWKDIDGFPGYQVNKLGDVRSFHDKNRGIVDTPHILKKRVINKYGHSNVALYKDGVSYNKPIHRLVAEAFIPNPNNHPLVRHKNSNASDNNVRNLAWGTHKDNTKDSIDIGTFHYNLHTFTREEIAKSNETNRTPIKALDIDTKKELIFQSQQEAARSLKLSQGNINMVLNGRRNKTGGYRFEYIDKKEEYKYVQNN